MLLSHISGRPIVQSVNNVVLMARQLALRSLSEKGSSYTYLLPPVGALFIRAVQLEKTTTLAVLPS